MILPCLFYNSIQSNCAFIGLYIVLFMLILMCKNLSSEESLLRFLMIELTYETTQPQFFVRVHANTTVNMYPIPQVKPMINKDDSDTLQIRCHNHLWQSRLRLFFTLLLKFLEPLKQGHIKLKTLNRSFKPEIICFKALPLEVGHLRG